jgi:hypothetical protein
VEKQDLHDAEKRDGKDKHASFAKPQLKNERTKKSPQHRCETLHPFGIVTIDHAVSGRKVF